jgi:acetyl esterase/lipase
VGRETERIEDGLHVDLLAQAPYVAGMTELDEAAEFVGRALRALARRVAKGPRRPGWPVLYEAAVETMRAHTERTRGLDAPAQRAHAEFLVRPTPAIRAVPRRSVELGGVPAAWFEPPNAADAPVFFFLHGGGYVFGSIRTHADLVARLAIAGSARAVSIDYRLAPEHPCPAAIDDAERAYLAMLEEGIDPGVVTVVGDSSGAGLALALAIRLRDHGTRLPAALGLFSPWVDLASRAPSYDAHASFDWGSREALAQWAAWYAGPLALDEPHVSPLFADLSGLPPILVHVGGAEMVYDDACRLEARAREAGVGITLRTWPELVHAFVAFHPFVAAADDAVRETAEFARVRARPRK